MGLKPEMGDSSVNDSQTFIVKERNFSYQYAHLYATRLFSSKAKLESKARNKWGKDVTVCALADIIEGNECVVTGTIFKQQQNKPSILREVSDENYVVPLPTAERYACDTDVVILEDELQRICLVGDIDKHTLVTGIVVALLGYEDDRGKFHVKDMCFSECASAPQLSLSSNDKWVAFVSGFELNDEHASSPLQLFADMLTGNLGSPETETLMSQVCRLVIAGNSVSISKPQGSILDRARTIARQGQRGDLALSALDLILCQIAAIVETDLMPGILDPVNYILPQQPIHKCLLPQVSKYSSFHGVTNPYQCHLEGRLIVGSSGQPVTDILRCSRIPDAITVLKSCLSWGHLAPTCPDTLAAYPFIDKDPFILETCPDIFFVGNQAEFVTSLVPNSDGRPVRLLVLPSFKRTPLVALVNLRTLDCRTISLLS